jgi:hypothetical protein
VKNRDQGQGGGGVLHGWQQGELKLAIYGTKT